MYSRGNSSVSAVFDDLTAAAEGHLSGGNVVHNDGAGTDERTVPDGHRGHEGGIAADEAVIADDGAELVPAVVVAGDGACAEVHAGADFGVAEVGEMIGL